MAVIKGTNTKPLLTKISRTTKNIKCPVKGCKEYLWVDGTTTRQLPYGFGSGSGKYSGKFVVEVIKQKGYWCECPKHGRVIAIYSSTKATKVPRGINSKLKKAQSKAR